MFSSEMEIWNTRCLKAPPINSCTASLKEVDIRLLNIALSDGFVFFQNQPALHTEAAILSRIIYRLKMKLRSSKEFKFIEKLARLLRTYLQLDIGRCFRTLLNFIPQVYKPNQTHTFTKNMMDYLLVRLQGLGKVLSRILETCKIAFGWTYQKLRLGHVWKVTIVVYAAISRLFVVAKNILRFTCELYDKLLPLSENLGNVGVLWLPPGYIFPTRLDHWLKIDWLELDKNIIEIKDDEPSLLAFLADDDDDDDDVKFCDEYVLVKDDISVVNTNPAVNIEKLEDYSDDEEPLDISITVFVNQENNQNEKRNVESVDGDSDIDIGEVIEVNDTPVQTARIRHQANVPELADFTPLQSSPNRFSKKSRKNQKLFKQNLKKKKSKKLGRKAKRNSN